jgi:hypothetical protein
VRVFEVGHFKKKQKTNDDGAITGCCGARLEFLSSAQIGVPRQDFFRQMHGAGFRAQNNE